MSERKVLNKYYPPDYDPAKIPKLKLARDRQYVVRLMAPFNMRCKTCGEYIYKGKKFNSRKETVLNETYLGLLIFRFYIKCPRCVSEITFKTDPENMDYAMEHGATRNFQASKMLAEQEKQIQQEREDEEMNNPMKVLENRTRDSQREMAVLENLEELHDLKTRQSSILENYKLIELHAAESDKKLKLQEEEDEAFVRSLFGRADGASVKRIHESDSSDEDDSSSQLKKRAPNTSLGSEGAAKPTDILTDNCAGVSGTSSSRFHLSTTPSTTTTITTTTTTTTVKSWERSVGQLSSSKKPLSSLVKIRQKNKPDPPFTAERKKQDSDNGLTVAAWNGPVSTTTSVSVKGVNDVATPPSVSACLGLVGNYSSSENED